MTRDTPAQALGRLRAAALAHPALARGLDEAGDGASPDDVIQAVRYLLGSRGPATGLDDIRLELAWDAYSEWEARHVLAAYPGAPCTDWVIPGMGGFGSYMARAEDTGVVESTFAGGTLSWQPTGRGAMLAATPAADPRDPHALRRERRIRAVGDTACVVALSPFLAVLALASFCRTVAPRRVR